MRRRAGVEGVQEEAEALLHVVLRVAEHREDPALHVGAVVAKAPRAELDAVGDDVVVRPVHALGVALEERDVLLERRHEGHVGVRELPALAALEERKADHEEHVPVAAVGAPEAAPEVRAQPREDVIGLGRGVRLEEEQRARARAGALDHARALLVGEELRDRRLPRAVGHDPHPRQAARAELLARKGLEAVDLAAAEGVGVVDRQALHDAAFVDRAAEGPEAARGEDVRELDQLELDAGVGLVAAVARHRLRVRQAREGPRQAHADHVLPRAGGELLERGEHVVDADERHLEVELRELELAVGAQVLVAEAARDLEVALEARDHEELLQELGRLRQGVELAGVQPARHQEVARTLGRGLGQDRRLDLDEAEARQRLAQRAPEPVAQAERALERRAPEVVDPMAQAHRLVHVRLVLDREGRRRGDVQQAELARRDLHLAGGQVRVHGLGRTPLDDAAHEHDELGAQVLGTRVALGFDVGPEHDLHEARGIAQIDEDHAAVVAPAVHPARDDDRLADVGRPERGAGVAAAPVAEPVECQVAAGRGGHAGPLAESKNAGKTGGSLAEAAAGVQRAWPRRGYAPWRSDALHTRLRPTDFARYIALSERSSSSSRVRPWAG